MLTDRTESFQMNRLKIEPTSVKITCAMLEKMSTGDIMVCALTFALRGAAVPVTPTFTCGQLVVAVPRGVSVFVGGFK